MKLALIISILVGVVLLIAVVALGMAWWRARQAAKLVVQPAPDYRKLADEAIKPLMDQLSKKIDDALKAEASIHARLEEIGKITDEKERLTKKTDLLNELLGTTAQPTQPTTTPATDTTTKIPGSPANIPLE